MYNNEFLNNIEALELETTESYSEFDSILDIFKTYDVKWDNNMIIDQLTGRSVRNVENAMVFRAQLEDTLTEHGDNWTQDQRDIQAERIEKQEIIIHQLKTIASTIRARYIPTQEGEYRSVEDQLEWYRAEEGLIDFDTAEWKRRIAEAKEFGQSEEFFKREAQLDRDERDTFKIDVNPDFLEFVKALFSNQGETQDYNVSPMTVRQLATLVNNTIQVIGEGEEKDGAIFYDNEPKCHMVRLSKKVQKSPRRYQKENRTQYKTFQMLALKLIKMREELEEQLEEIEDARRNFEMDHIGE